jgi:hypothetical protein
MKETTVTDDFPRSFFVRDLELLQIQQFDVKSDKLFQGDPALLVPHPLCQFPLGDLFDEPIQFLLDLFDTPLASVPFSIRLKDRRFDPERKDLPPNVQVGFRSIGRRDFRDFSGEERDGFAELTLLSELERRERVERRGE